jgi:hypothetical protein
MFAVRSRDFQLGLMFVTALMLAVAAPTASQAYTPEEQQACSGDAFRLCSSDIPDVDRVTVCMVRHKAELSPGCRVFFRPSEPERLAAPAAAGKPLSIKPAAAKKSISEKKSVSEKPRKPKKPAKPAAT